MTLLAGILAYYLSAWFALAIPFILLGSFCSAPNLNLADGFLVVLATLIGIMILMFISEPADLAIISGSLSGWFLGAMEKRTFAKQTHYSSPPSDSASADPDQHNQP